VLCCDVLWYIWCVVVWCAALRVVALCSVSCLFRVAMGVCCVLRVVLLVLRVASCRIALCCVVLYCVVMCLYVFCNVVLYGGVV